MQEEEAIEDDEHYFHGTSYILCDPGYGKVYKALYKTPQLQNLLLELNWVIRNNGFVPLALSYQYRVEEFCRRFFMEVVSR
jgi:hypothetical protein